jgi:hypothetical protein
MVSMIERVRTFKQLNTAALEQRQSRVLNGWYMLRHLDSQGSGNLDYGKTKVDYCNLMGCCEETFRKLMRDGDADGFWSIGILNRQKRVFLRSVDHVASILRVDRASLTKVPVPLSSLTASVRKKRATLYATLHSKKASLSVSRRNSPPPRSRAFIKKETGVSRQTQRTYEKQAGVIVSKRYEIVPSEGRSKPFQITAEMRKASPSLVGVVKDRGLFYPQYQIPNSYESPYSTDGKKRLASPANRDGHFTANSSYLPVYFTDVHDAALSFHRNPRSIKILDERLNCFVLWTTQ